MKSYKELSIAELKELQGELNKEYEEAKAKGLKLNMARGLPSAEQLDMEADFFNTLSPESDFKSEAGIDCRNYGELVGIHIQAVIQRSSQISVFFHGIMHFLQHCPHQGCTASHIGLQTHSLGADDF